MLQRSVYSTNRLKKRERTQNWAFEEKKYLLELCKKDMNIIENKRLDADLTALKNRAWKFVHQEFSKVFGNERNCNRLKEQWRRMKACARSEILDYTHRVAKYGQEVADKKRPSSFTFEIWEFMQNAKRTCKTEAIDGVDYSKILLSLGDAAQSLNAECDGDGNGSTDGNKDDDNNEPTTVLSDEDDSFQWHKPSQNMCEVELRDESSSETTPVPNAHQNEAAEDVVNAKRIRLTPQMASSPLKQIDVNAFDDNIPSLSINNVATTLNTLNLLKNERINLMTNKQISSSSQSNSYNSNKNDNNEHIKLLIEMQAREHTLRMEILRAQLETAKFNRDIAEINKVILLKQLTDGSRSTESDREDE